MRNYASLLAPTNATGAAHWTAKANAVSANVMKHLWDSEREQLTAHIYNLHNVPGSSKNWSVCGDKWGSTEHAKDGGGAQNGKTSYSEPVLDSKRSLNQDRLGISIVKVEEEKASCAGWGCFPSKGSPFLGVAGFNESDVYYHGATAVAIEAEILNSTAQVLQQAKAASILSLSRQTQSVLSLA
jgi:hypothetical protein